MSFTLRSVSILFVFCFFSTGAFSQSTAFTYQGSLTQAGSPANGAFDFKFRLYDSQSGGNQAGGDVLLEDVSVVSGVFSVSLSFGNQFPAGGTRWLEIEVRPGASTGSYSLLSPRHQITSSPFAVQTIRAQFADTANNAANATNAANLGGVPAANYVQTNDPRLTDARTPMAGSGSYIQNGNSQQASSNFWISGQGTANTLVAVNTLRVGATSNYPATISPASNFGLRVVANGTGGRVASFGGTGDFHVDAPGIDGGRFLIRENGNFGFGTNDTSRAFLTVQAPSGNTNIFMKPTGTTKGINFGIAGTPTNSVLYISQYDGTTYQDRMIIEEDGRINIPGKVSIGTAFQDSTALHGAVLIGNRKLIMKGDNGTSCYLLYMAASGILTSVQVTCPAGMPQ
ncbi:MAG TPA: hypothetical protein VJL58_08835 [Pyrinomonadaceae bacterium]|nr:hypothetical protein [Pyrinomonadaceae bacterium]